MGCGGGSVSVEGIVPFSCAGVSLCVTLYVHGSAANRALVPIVGKLKITFRKRLIVIEYGRARSSSLLLRVCFDSQPCACVCVYVYPCYVWRVLHPPPLHHR